MGPNGSENFKTLLHLQIAAKRFETCPEFSSQWSSQTTWDFWNFEFSIFNDFSTNRTIVNIVAHGEIKKTSNIWKTSDRREKRSEIWDSWVVC